MTANLKMIQDKSKSSLRSASVKLTLWQEIQHFVVHFAT